MSNMRKYMNLFEASSYEFYPVQEIEPGVYVPDGAYSGDSFALSKEEMHQTTSKRVKMRYESGLFGTIDKPVYVYSHPKWEGYMCKVEDLTK